LSVTCWSLDVECVSFGSRAGRTKREVVRNG
jgi:hypothetical protein